MRIGTWNLAGRWKPEHHEFLIGMDCEVLLLTEVSERVELSGYAAHLTEESMAQRRRWAGVFSRTSLAPLPDPHPASAMAQVGPWTFCSSILPWRGAPSRHPWVGERHAAKTENAVAALLPSLPTTGLIWGGDWNHALEEREYAGTMAGRGFITEALAKLGLTVPTTWLAHCLDGLLTIDHVAVPVEADVRDAWQLSAVGPDGRRLSDHDAYVVEVRSDRFASCLT
ncbi:hypothetical protein [Nocardioides sp.]|uniref:hypothetical protein n=1 Tax=Nocardioides sp. TaxID=35761 RepID=UPI003568D653